MTDHMRICVPWRSDYGQRERVWRACAARWAAMFPVGTLYLGTSHGQPFNRSAARNAAVEELTLDVPDWEVAVLADADVTVADAGQVLGAVEGALKTGRLVFAHSWQATLSAEATERVLAGEDPTAIPRDEADWEQNTLSGVLAIPRQLWDALGGYDERFVGWGGEEVSLVAAARVLAGHTERVPGHVYHLHHDRPREEREGQPHYARNMALYARYQAATKSTTAMREVLSR